MYLAAISKYIFFESYREESGFSKIIDQSKHEHPKLSKAQEALRKDRKQEEQGGGAFPFCATGRRGLVITQNTFKGEKPGWRGQAQRAEALGAGGVQGTKRRDASLLFLFVFYHYDLKGVMWFYLVGTEVAGQMLGIISCRVSLSYGVGVPGGGGFPALVRTGGLLTGVWWGDLSSGRNGPERNETQRQRVPWSLGQRGCRNPELGRSPLSRDLV